MKNIFKNKRNILIMMFALVVIMGIGFAAYSQQLQIKDTSSIDSNWNVYIKSVTPGTPVGGATGSGTVDNKTTASLTTDLKYPGDSIEYTITVANDGNIDAEVEKVELKPAKENTVIKYSIIGEADIQYLNSGDEKIFKVKVEYDPTKTGTATEEQKSNSLTLTVDYVQKGTGSGTYVPGGSTLTTVYAYHTDNKKIGTSILTESDYVTDYTQVSSYSTRPWFLKYEIDEEGVIQKSYVCAKYSFIDEPVCVQGGDSSYYASNKSILERLQVVFNDNSGSCNFGDTWACCGADGRDGIDYRVCATTTENTSGQSGSGPHCFINSNGYAGYWG